MKNAISIDLEDWFCAHNLNIQIEDWDRLDLRVVANARRAMEVLDKRGTRATFFVLGWIAARVPDLVREIERRGHEIATHGFSHTLLTETTPDAFERDLVNALRITRACASRPIIGYRAPSFSVVRRTTWALDILAKHGIAYDSSIFPFGGHPDYGIPGAPLSIHRIGAVTEVPLSVAVVAGKRIPCGGGGYFRLFPYALTASLIRRVHRDGRPLIFYLHPWEFDPDQPRHPMSPAKKFRHYYNLGRTAPRLDRLLGDFEFAPIREILSTPGREGAP